MKEYIDREKLIAEYDRVHVGPAGGARKLMVDAPTADVVEVVRCKECKYWENGKDYEPYCNHCLSTMSDTTENDFCSYGERKDNNG